MCGFNTILWQSFCKAILCLQYKGSVFRGKDPLNRVQGVYRICHDNSGPRLNSILYQSQGSKCTDPKDRVYAVLSLLEPYERLGIKPDYRMTTYEVF